MKHYYKTHSVKKITENTQNVGIPRETAANCLLKIWIVQDVNNIWC